MFITQDGCMHILVICCVLMTKVIESTISTNATFSGYRKWTNPNSSNRDYMYCPTTCDDPSEDDSCCCCKSKACWELDSVKCGLVIGQLHIEYVDIFGSTVVIANPGDHASINELVHPNGYLTSIPGNICDWSETLVTVDFKNNRLSNIDKLRCLKNLDVLLLDNNKIKHVDNTTFAHMDNLRILTLSKNGIEDLDPNTIHIQNGNILKVDFSYNEVDTFDITNLIRPGSFCSLSYEGCSVAHQTNVLGFQLLDNILHGPGDIILNHTDIREFVNFTTLGVTDFTNLPKYFDGKIVIDAASINCDCNLYPLISSLGPDIFRFWPNLYEFNISFICHSPERMKGIDLYRIYEQADWDKLTCDLTVYCPYKCSCLDIPSQDKVIVNCSGKGLTQMPSDMPVGFWNNNQIDLLLDANDISQLEDRNYLHRLVNLNLSGNPIETIKPEFVARFPNIELDIRDQKLTTFPRNIQRLKPTKIHFGHHPIKCDCENVWTGDWMRINNAYGRLMCDVNGEEMPAEWLSADSLGCVQTETVSPFIPLSASLGIISFLMLVIGLVYIFRLEIFLLKRKYRRRENDGSAAIFISFCERNDAVFSFIADCIRPTLQKAGYNVSIPWFDITPGESLEDSVANMIDQSETYIIFLCSMYMDDSQTASELETIWTNFTRDARKSIIVVNFDCLESSSIKDDRLRAFVRIGEDLDFSYRESKLIDRLRKRIGKPRGKSSTSFDDTDETADNSGQTGNDLQNLQSDIKKKRLAVFARLNVKASTCNCKYRKCYLHSEEFYKTINKKAMVNGATSSIDRKHSTSDETISDSNPDLHQRPRPVNAKTLADVEITL